MNRVKFTLLIFLAGTLCLSAQTWTETATDGSGDGSDARLLDGTKLEYRSDEMSDSVWFRITTAEINAGHAVAFGVNIMVNIPSGGSTFNFWGSDNTNPFHKLVTAWVTGSAPSNYAGTIGVSNSTGVGANNYTNLSSNNLDITVDAASSTITIGMKRTDLVTDDEMGGTSVTMKVAAAVGSNEVWNDDIYSASAEMTVTRTAVSVEDLETGSLGVYPNPATDRVHVADKVNSEFVNGKITDLTGRTIVSFGVEEIENGLDVSKYENGMYILSIRNEYGQTLTQRFQVSH